MDEIGKKKQVVALLMRFQKGYHDRNVINVRDFVKELFVDDENIFIIGTSAVTDDYEEWGDGREKVINIIKEDWKYWGDLDLNVDGARITFEGNTAYVALTGTVYEQIKSENYYNYRLNLIADKLEDFTEPKEKLIEIIRDSADTLLETCKGEDYYWPLRLSILAVKRNGIWKFKNMHFSYPITFYPQVRMD